jgi:Mrp family chromosome partitioning ATPase
MSRNFELMQQVDRDFKAPAILKSNPIPSETQEKVRSDGVRFDLGSVPDEKTLQLVQKIFLSQSEKTPRVVLFAAMDRGARCSRLCLQVAQALRNSARGSICLLEANFRSPTLATLLGMSDRHGLAEPLVQNGTVRAFAEPIQADNNVWLLSCASLTADSPGLLNSDRIGARLCELRQEFDYVLVDAPSMTAYGDVLALGRFTDGLILTLEANVTPKEVVLNVIEKLRVSEIEILGAVLA